MPTNPEQNFETRILAYSAAYNDGKKQPNGDNYFYCNDEDKKEGIKAIAVFYGVSGSGNPDRASDRAKENFEKAFGFKNAFSMEKTEKTPERIIYELLAGLHIRETTFAAGIAENNRLFPYYLGDSRIYLLRDGNKYLLTRDHSVMNMFEDLGDGDIIKFRDEFIERFEKLESYYKPYIIRSFFDEFCGQNSKKNIDKYEIDCVYALKYLETRQPINEEYYENIKRLIQENFDLLESAVKNGITASLKQCSTGILKEELGRLDTKYISNTKIEYHEEENWVKLEKGDIVAACTDGCNSIIDELDEAQIRDPDTAKAQCYINGLVEKCACGNGNIEEADDSTLVLMLVE